MVYLGSVLPLEHFGRIFTQLPAERLRGPVRRFCARLMRYASCCA